jgi:hypothetical protein
MDSLMEVDLEQPMEYSFLDYQQILMKMSIDHLKKQE